MQDEQFPYLDEFCRVDFPDIGEDQDICASGGNLSPGMLLSAYEQGVFPWYSEDSPILWWNPRTRCVLLPGDLKISASMRKVIKKQQFLITVDTAFPAVIHACSAIKRRHEEGTWISQEIIDGYSKLAELGFAHSFEVWGDSPEAGDDAQIDDMNRKHQFMLEEGMSRGSKVLIGGLYGVSLGKAFFGESMFSRVSNASKIAFIMLYQELIEKHNFLMIDCQVMNPHLASLGAREISRDVFHEIRKEAMKSETLIGSWTPLW